MTMKIAADHVRLKLEYEHPLDGTQGDQGTGDEAMPRKVRSLDCRLDRANRQARRGWV